MNLQTIFPVTIGIKQLERDFTADELSFLNGLELGSNSGNSISVDGNVLDAAEMKDLKQFCLNSINEYMRNIYKPKNNLGLRITQSWINVTKEGEFHHRHSHANSVFSASFYISTNKEDRIYFYNPRKSIFEIEAESYDVFNSDSWWIPATQGAMVMFPSWLEHDVQVKTHSGDRMSLSFNTFFAGSLGKKEGRTELILG